MLFELGDVPLNRLSNKVSFALDVIAPRSLFCSSVETQSLPSSISGEMSFHGFELSQERSVFSTLAPLGVTQVSTARTDTSVSSRTATKGLAKALPPRKRTAIRVTLMNEGIVA